MRYYQLGRRSLKCKGWEQGNKNGREHNVPSDGQQGQNREKNKRKANEEQNPSNQERTNKQKTEEKRKKKKRTKSERVGQRGKKKRGKAKKKKPQADPERALKAREGWQGRGGKEEKRRAGKGTPAALL